MGRSKPQEGLKVEYSGRVSAKGKVGTSGAFPGNSKCVCAEQSEPRWRGVASVSIPCSLAPSPGPAQDPGILIQETEKDTVASVLSKKPSD